LIQSEYGPVVDIALSIRILRNIFRIGMLLGALSVVTVLSLSSIKADVGAFKAEPVFYRLLVDIEIERTPFTIDVVVICQQRRTQGRAYGGTDETLASSAYVFALRVPGDHAVKVRTMGAPGAPKPCSGDTTANGRVPKDWLPLIVWYEKADELAHGIGYADQDAYASPLAKIAFRGARVEAATAQDFERFMRTGPKNLVPAYMANVLCCDSFPSMKRDGVVPLEYLMHPQKAWSFAGPPSCGGVRRVRLSEAQREQVREVWPKGRPNRWQPPAEREQFLMRSVLQNTPQGDRPETYDPGRASTSDDTIFPVLANEALQDLERNPSRAENWADLALVDEVPSLRGFLFCDSEVPSELFEALLKHPRSYFGSVSQRKCRLGEMEVRVRIAGCNDTSWIVFERDEYAFFFFSKTGA
jgi:hypothetical protein